MLPESGLIPGHLKPSWGDLAAILGALGARIRGIFAPGCHLGVIPGHLGTIFGHTFQKRKTHLESALRPGHLKPSSGPRRGYLGGSWAPNYINFRSWVSSWCHLGPSWDNLGPYFQNTQNTNKIWPETWPSQAFLKPSRGYLGGSWGQN